MNATVTYVIVIILHGDAFHSILECKLSIMQFTYPPLAKDYCSTVNTKKFCEIDML